MRNLFCISLILIVHSAIFAQAQQLPENLRLRSQAQSLYEAKKYPEAAAVAERLLQIEKKTAPKNWRDLADATLLLAMIQRDHLELTQKNWEEKDVSTADGIVFKFRDSLVPLFNEAIDIYQNKLGGDSIPLAKAHFELAMYLTRNDLKFPTVRPYDLKKVADHFDRAIALRNKLLGEDNDATMATIHRAANFHRNNAEPALALPLYQTFLERIEKKYGKTSPYLLSAMTEMACVLTALGLDNEAAETTARLKTISGAVPEVPPFDLTMRNRDEKIGKMVLDNPSMKVFGTELTRQKWLMVNIELDEKGDVVQVAAEDPKEKNKNGKDVKEKAEKDVRKFKFRPVIYQGAARSVKGIIWYPYSIKL